MHEDDPAGGGRHDANPVDVALKRLHPDAVAPKQMTEHAAGYDISACLGAGEVLVVEAGARVLVPTGWALAIPSGFEGQVRPRSGLAWRHGVTVLNAPGTIDADYRGELKVLLFNAGDATFTIEHGDRVAQLVIAPVMSTRWEIVDDLPVPFAARSRSRGLGGFGSTGR